MLNIIQDSSVSLIFTQVILAWINEKMFWLNFLEKLREKIKQVLVKLIGVK